MLINKRRFSMCCSSIPSGDGFDGTERGESLLYTCITQSVLVLPMLLALSSEVMLVGSHKRR
jgi:hypothetical protein